MTEISLKRLSSDATVTSMTEKFLDSTQDLYTNAFPRLWFMAEFTCDGDDYTVTEELLNDQYLANRIFDRMDRRRPKTGRAPAEVALEEGNGEIFEETAKAVISGR